MTYFSDDDTTYFSDRELGEHPKNQDEIGEAAWDGLQALVRARINDGSFGATYPKSCPDGLGPIGTDENMLLSAMHGEIPNLPKPPWRLSSYDESLPTVDILDPDL